MSYVLISIDPGIRHQRTLRRLLKNPCIVSGTISRQIKEREGGDAANASATPSDAEVRSEMVRSNHL